MMKIVHKEEKSELRKALKERVDQFFKNRKEVIAKPPFKKIKN